MDIGYVATNIDRNRYRRIRIDIDTYIYIVDSKKLEYGCRVKFCWCSFFVLLWDQGTVIFQLSGFYCSSAWFLNATQGNQKY